MAGEDLFAGTAWYYARYRPGYPPEMIDWLVEQMALDGTGRLLDLGCGTGQLILPLAPHVTAAIGMDPDIDMLAEAAAAAMRMGIENVEWVAGRSDALT
ncbi:MAG TPA: methyltransferase domain-containing protein, partial [Thermomicrobiales bacterium]|nr:methyltransferase domain-containing protein [Thermomicrobiales bacterium]